MSRRSACVAMRHSTYLLFGPTSGFLLATLLYKDCLRILLLAVDQAVNGSQWLEVVLLHSTFQHSVFSECGLLWASRSGLLGTTANLHEPPADPGNSPSADVHLQGDSVDCFSGLPHADQRPSLLCRHRHLSRLTFYCGGAANRWEVLTNVFK